MEFSFSKSKYLKFIENDSHRTIIIDNKYKHLNVLLIYKNEVNTTHIQTIIIVMMIKCISLKF